MKDIRKLFIYFIFIFLILKIADCQEKDCYFVKNNPIVFQQDSLRTSVAEEIIRRYRDSIKRADTLTLIGISKTDILEDLSFMIANPNSTKLNDSGYYCGIVVILNWMLNKMPDKYVKGVIDLIFYGETTFENGSKNVKLPKVLREKVDYSLIHSKNGKSRADIGNISISDFVLGVSLVYAEKAIQKVGLLWKNSTHRKANTGNFIFANTMPWEMDDYFRIIGIKEIKSSYYSPFENKEKIIANIVKAVSLGEMAILMENHLLTADRPKNFFYKIFGAHFILIHDFTVNYKCHTISISYWDYGSVKNHREQSEKGSPFAAGSLNAAIRRNNRLNKIKRDDMYLEISIDLFFKGLKGYWIPSYTVPNTLP